MYIHDNVLEANCNTCSVLTNDGIIANEGFDWRFEGNFVLNGGVNLKQLSPGVGVADGLIIENNTFGTTVGSSLPCITLTSMQGAAQWTVFHNRGGCKAGFIVSQGTTQCKIIYNQVEQPSPSNEPNSAIIDLQGTVAYPINGCEIVGNNINAHTLANINVRLDHVTNATIDGNVLSVNGGGVGIVTTSNARSIMAGLRNQFSLGTGATVWGGPAGSITPLRLAGARLFLTTPTLQLAQLTDRISSCKASGTR